MTNRDRRREMSDAGATFRDYATESSNVLLAAGESINQKLVDRVTEMISSALLNGRALLVCGNGGSASDSMHIAAELVGRFLHERQPLKVICLAENPAFLTAWSND